MSSKSILITGANGFLGAWLAKALVARGDDVRCLVRAGSDASALANVAAKIVAGDVTDAASLTPALEGVHTVFHLAGIRRGATRDAFMQVNAEGTRHVADAMVAAGSKRFVLVGSLAATGPSVGGVARVEEDSFAPQEWYGESKVEAEKIAFTYSDRLEVTCCRPARIIGPGDHENLTFFKLVKKGIVLRLGGPERKLSFVDVEDVVDQLLLQADLPAAVGESFFCASDETESVEELMRIVGQVLELEPRTVYVPELVLSALGSAADLITNVSGRKLPLNRKLARQLLAPGWTCRIDKARRLLGYTPRRTIAESLRRSAESYLKLGWL
ncbi:MAG: NAD-dependent epimerase/dehydratase family protein [Archangium sp.]|nr:NAD-dependent epimerase/dehydratase family protein [Archangium sp.]MDP3576027.1 NAD-dependent epimerase/dehydratase family protein [Archangium sp.]